MKKMGEKNETEGVGDRRERVRERQTDRDRGNEIKRELCHSRGRERMPIRRHFRSCGAFSTVQLNVKARTLHSAK